MLQVIKKYFLVISVNLSVLVYGAIFNDFNYGVVSLLLVMVSYVLNSLVLNRLSLKLANISTKIKTSSPDVTEVTGQVCELSNLITGELNALKDSTAQVNDLVSDAVTGLAKSFSTLSSETQSQEHLILSLISNMSDDGEENSNRITVKKFAEETDEILNYFCWSYC